MKQLKDIVTVKAPGKLMLMGEHAVVYGYPCLVTAIDKYLTVKIQKLDKQDDFLDLPWGVDDRIVRETLSLFRRKYQVKQRIFLKTESSLTGYGLGSSSATIVATFTALCLLFSIKLAKKELFDLSFQVILSIQKRASGFDLASAIYGGTIIFNGKSKKVEHLTDQPLPLIVVYTGTKGDTQTMIDKVADLRKKQTQFSKNVFSQIGKLVEKGRVSLEKKDWRLLGEYFNQSQLLLKSLGISTRKIDRFIEVILETGAYGTKLSGAGGGDCIIALISDKNRIDVVNALKKAGGKVLDVKTGAEGVKEI